MQNPAPQASLKMRTVDLSRHDHPLAAGATTGWAQSDTLIGFTSLADTRAGQRSYGCFGILETATSFVRRFAALDLRERAVNHELVPGLRDEATSALI